MKSSEIAAKDHTDMSANAWMQEIALQLARLNEHFAPPPAIVPVVPIEVEQPKRKRGRPRKVA